MQSLLTPITVSFPGAGYNAYELVTKEDKDGNEFVEKQLFRRTKDVTITRMFPIEEVMDRIPSVLRNQFTHGRKTNFKAWKLYKANNQDKVIRRNCEDHFWDLPEVHGRGNRPVINISFTIDEPLW